MKNKYTKPLSGKSAEEWQEALWDKLLEEIVKIKSKQDLKKSLEVLFSQPEKRLILRRLATNALIRQGKSYQEIGEVLWISSATISAIKKNILNQHENYKSHKSIIKEKLGKGRDEQPSKSNPSRVEKIVGDFFSNLFEQNRYLMGNDYFVRRARKGK